MPFKYLKRHVLKHLNYFVVMCLNVIPAKQWLSEKLSPSMIVTHKKVVYSNHCKGDFGSYVMANDDPDVTNDMKPRTRQSILLELLGNIQ